MAPKNSLSLTPLSHSPHETSVPYCLSIAPSTGKGYNTCCLKFFSVASFKKSSIYIYNYIYILIGISSSKLSFPGLNDLSCWGVASLWLSCLFLQLTGAWKETLQKKKKIHHLVFHCPAVSNIPLKEQRTIPRRGYNARPLKAGCLCAAQECTCHQPAGPAASDEMATAPKSRWTQRRVQGLSCRSRALLRRPPSCRCVRSVRSICSVAWKPISFFSLCYPPGTTPRPSSIICSFRLMGDLLQYESIW